MLDAEDGFISRSGFLQFVYAFFALTFIAQTASREIIMWNNDKAPGPSKHIPLVSSVRGSGSDVVRGRGPSPRSRGRSQQQTPSVTSDTWDTQGGSEGRQ